MNKCSNVQSECPKRPVPAASRNAGGAGQEVIDNAISQWLASFTDRAVNHFLFQTVPFLLDTALPRPWSVIHTLVGSRTPRSRWVQIWLFGVHVAYGIRTASRARPTATRTTFDAAGSVNLSTVLTTLNVQLLFGNIFSIVLWKLKLKCLPAMQLSLETSQPNNWRIWCYFDCQIDAKLST